MGGCIPLHRSIRCTGLYIYIYIYLDQAVMLQAELFAELAVDVALIQRNLFIKTL